MSHRALSLPLELEAFASYLDAQVPDVRELFQYALAMLMVEVNKAKVVDMYTTDDGRQRLLIWTLANDSFSIVKPLVSDGLLLQIMEIARGVVPEDNDLEDR